MGNLGLDVKQWKMTYGGAIADVAGTADSTFSSNETTMINDLRTAVNAILAALRNADMLSLP